MNASHLHRLPLSFEFRKAMTAVCVFFLARGVVLADSAAWLANPPSGNWNSASNWNPMIVPNGPNDTAGFYLPSSQTAIVLSANTTVNSIFFGNSANAYTISTTPAFTLTISGTGITNGSMSMQSFVLPVNSSGQFGNLRFINGASAGEFVSFQANGGLNNHQQGSHIEFFNSSTAAAGTFTNVGGDGSGGSFGGMTIFHDTSTAASALLINNHATHASGGGMTQLLDGSSAGNSTILNNGSPEGFPAQPGGVIFSNNSVAGNATLINRRGGFAQFLDNSTASAATIVNYGADASAFGGFTYFSGNSTAGAASIRNTSGHASGYGGDAVTYFFNVASAGEATISNSGATSPDDLAGFTSFGENATAANATLIAESGSNGGNGSFIVFGDDSLGGTSRVKVLGNGNLDITMHNLPGVTIGSLEGAGNVFLGNNNLTVGTNNLSTTFSGTIQDILAPIKTSNGLFTKIGVGILSFEGGTSNDHIADSVTLSIASGSAINLNFVGTPDTVRSLIVDGVAQLPGLYGSTASGAPHPLPQFTGTGEVLARMSVVSRKTHGSAGDFDINLPFGGEPGIECRSGGVNGDYQMVATFVSPVAFDGATVSAGTVSSTTGNGTTVLTVNLTGVTNAQTILVTLSNVNDGTTTETISIPMSILTGDVTGNGTVNSTDVSQTKLQSGQPATNANFREDINVNGSINATDVSSVKLQSGTALPQDSSAR